MGKPWKRTPEQTAYLKSQFRAYHIARKEHRLEAFRAQLSKGWFASWPERKVVFPHWEEGDTPLTKDQLAAVGTAVRKRIKQLYDYICWHSVAKPVRTKNPRSLLSRYLYKIRKANGSTKQSRRKRTVLEVYSDLHYKTKLLDKITAEVQRTAPSTPESNKECASRQLAIYRRIRAETWASELDDVKAEVQRIYDKERGANGDSSDSDDDNDSDDDDDPDTELSELQLLESQQECMDVIGSIITLFLKDASEATGWAFCVLGGGLDKTGEFKIANSFIGKTPAGSTFQQTHKAWQEEVVLPWFNFLRLRHPTEERVQRASLWAAEPTGTSSTASVAAQHESTNVAVQHESASNGPTSVDDDHGSAIAGTSQSPTSSLSSRPVSQVTTVAEDSPASITSPTLDTAVSDPVGAPPTTPPTPITQLPSMANLTPMSKFIVSTQTLSTWKGDDFHNTVPLEPSLPSTGVFNFSDALNWNFTDTASALTTVSSTDQIANLGMVQALPTQQASVATNSLHLTSLSMQQTMDFGQGTRAATAPDYIHVASTTPPATNSLMHSEVNIVPHIPPIVNSTVPLVADILLTGSNATSFMANATLHLANDTVSSMGDGPANATLPTAGSPAHAVVAFNSSTNAVVLPVAGAVNTVVPAIFHTVPSTATTLTNVSAAPTSITPSDAPLQAVDSMTNHSLPQPTTSSTMKEPDLIPAASTQKKRKSHEEEAAHLILPDGIRRTCKPRTDENNASVPPRRRRKD